MTDIRETELIIVRVKMNDYNFFVDCNNQFLTIKYYALTQTVK